MSGGGFGAIPDMLMGKKPGDAIKDNLLMAAMVGTGMAAAPALAGSAMGGSAMANGAFLGEGVASGIGAWDGAAAAAKGGGLLKDMAGYAKPMGDALGAANQAKGLLSSNPMQPSPLMQQRQPTDLGALSAQLEQAVAQQGQADMARRKQRYGLLGGA